MWLSRSRGVDDSDGREALANRRKRRVAQGSARSINQWKRSGASA